MQCGLKNYNYFKNLNAIRPDYNGVKTNRPVGRHICSNDRFELSFKQEVRNHPECSLTEFAGLFEKDENERYFHDKFLLEIGELLADPEKRNIEAIEGFLKDKLGKDVKLVLNSEDTIDKLLQPKFSKKREDFINELKIIEDKIHDGKMPLTHRKKDIEDLHKNFKDALKEYKRQNKNGDIEVREDDFGFIFEDIAADAVKKYIVPTIAKRIAAEPGEPVSEEVEKQLIQLNGVRLNQIEFDHVIIRAKDKPKPVNGKYVYNNAEVVGIVETKYSPLLVNRGFKHKIDNIKKLRNSKYDYEKREYTDPDMVNRFNIGDKSFIFSPDSFERFKINMDDDSRCKNIYFVTSNAPLVCMNEEIAEKIAESDEVLSYKTINVDNELNGNAKRSIFERYKKLGLEDNLLFIHDDFDGFSLPSIVFYDGIRKMSGDGFYQYAPKYLEIEQKKIDRYKSSMNIPH